MQNYFHYMACWQWRQRVSNIGGRSPPSLLSSPLPSLPLPSPPYPLPLPPLPLEVGPLNPARGSGGALLAPQRGLGRSPILNRIWCPGSTVTWGPSLPFPSLFLPSSLAQPLPLPQSGVQIQQGVWGSAVSSPSEVWGGAPAKIEFGAF